MHITNDYSLKREIAMTLRTESLKISAKRSMTLASRILGIGVWPCLIISVRRNEVNGLLKVSIDRF